MILKQYYLGCLAHASYLIGDEASGRAAVVDPQRDIDQYLADAQADGLTIEAVFLSHFHADFLAGHLELRDRVGADIYLGARAQAEYEFNAMDDEEVLELGSVRLQVLSTPGHSPESIRIVCADQPDTPDYFTYDAILNTKQHPMLETSLSHGLVPLTVEQVQEQAKAGAQLLDTREPSDFAGAHVAGSLNVGLQGQYATWAGTLLSTEEPIILIAERGREEEAAIRLGRIGFDKVAGFLDGGMEALDGRPDLVRRMERITAGSLSEKLSAQAPTIIDVRAPGEFAEAHIPDSVNVSLNKLGAYLEQGVEGELVVHCAGGYRSSIAASLIMRELPEVPVADLVGGLEAWEAAGLPTITEDG